MRGKKDGQRWAYLTRSGSEPEVVAELGERAHILDEGLLRCEGRPLHPDARPREPIFARQAMRVSAEVEPALEAIAVALARAIPKQGAWTLQVTAPDGRDPKDPRRASADRIDAGLGEALEARLERRIAEAFVEDPLEADALAQVWVGAEVALVGVTPRADAMSPHCGGRRRVERDLAPTRGGLKLIEAFEWIGIGPERGETAVELDAGRGGFGVVAARRGARVTLVDPKLDRSDEPRCRGVRARAFEFEPEETEDWLLVNMTERPLEVAKLIAKWGRHVWARSVVVSFKLPMKQKLRTVERLLEILAEGHWQGLRARQLYNDREEVTIYGWLDPKHSIRGYRASFATAKRLRDGRKRS